jgi:hypothetical protein
MRRSCGSRSAWRSSVELSQSELASDNLFRAASFSLASSSRTVGETAEGAKTSPTSQ